LFTKAKYVFLIALVIISALYVVRSEFYGYDSYYFASITCDANSPYKSDGAFPLDELLFSFLPCNFVILKIILVSLFFFDLLIFLAISKLFFSKNNWVFVLFCCITPMLVRTAFAFENDAFALPLVFLSLYFILKHSLVDKKLVSVNLFLSLFFLSVSGIIWGGGIYYLIAFSFLSPIFLVLSIFAFIFLSGQIIGNVFNINIDMSVAENFLGNSIIFSCQYLIFLKKVFFYNMNYLFIFFLAIGFLNAKLFILCLPFYSLVLFYNFSKLYPDSGKIVLIIGGLAMFIIFSMPLTGYGLTQSYPNTQEHEVVQEFIHLAHEKEQTIHNDWTLGHLINFYKGYTEDHSGGFNILELNHYKNSLVLTRHDLNCEIIKTYPAQLIEKPLTIYQC